MKKTRLGLLALALLAAYSSGGTEDSHLVYVPLPPTLSKQDLPYAAQGLKEPLHGYITSQLRAARHMPVDKSNLDLIVILTDSAGQPILPDLEAARSAYLQKIKKDDSEADTNELAFSFNSPANPWTLAEETDLRTQLSDYYPTAKAVYGHPAFSITVNLRKDPTISYAGLYYPSLNEIVIKTNTDHDVICHEMIHAFRDDYVLGLTSYEEGMTRAAEIEVFDRLAAYTHNFDEAHSYTYDIYYEGLNQAAIGSRFGSFFNTNPNTFLLLRYQLAGYAWGKALIENSNFLARFNQLLYPAILSDPSTQWTESNLVSLAAAVQAEVEGKSFLSWYGQQAVLRTDPPSGYLLYQRINQYSLDYFYRDPSGSETMQANATLNWAVYNHNDVTLGSGSVVTTTYGTQSFFPPVPANYTGRLRVVVSTTSPAEPITNSVFRHSLYDPAFGSSGVFGVVADADVGSLTIAFLDQGVPPVTVNVTNGAFSAPTLGTVRGRFRANFTATNGASISRQFNKDASYYFLLLQKSADDLRIVSAQLIGADVRINFDTIAGHTYRLERAENLSAITEWSTVTGAASLASTGGIVQATDVGGAERARRFYRIRLLP